MTGIFKDLIGTALEVYIDMVVKSHAPEQYSISAQECYGYSTKNLEKAYMPIDLLEKPQYDTKLDPINPVKKIGFDTILNKDIKKDLGDLLKDRIITFV